MVEGCDWSSCILTSWIYIDFWSSTNLVCLGCWISHRCSAMLKLNIKPIKAHCNIFLCYLNWIHLRVSWQGPSKGSDQTCMWGLFCHHNKLTNLWNAAINHVNDLEKARLFMKHYKDQPSIVNFIVGFQVMESLLLEDDADLEQARARRSKTTCWATARMYKLSSGWDTTTHVPESAK